MPTCEAGPSRAPLRHHAPFLLLLGWRAPPIERPVCIEIDPTKLAVSELGSPDISSAPAAMPPALVRCPATTRIFIRRLGRIPSSRCQATAASVAAEPCPLRPWTRLAIWSWWSQTGSNRRPPACKAGALPTELWPRLVPALPGRQSRSGAPPGKWWAWKDLNFRPHAYQACALTN